MEETSRGKGLLRGRGWGGGRQRETGGWWGVIERGNNNEEKEEETKNYQRQHQLYTLLRTQGKGRGEWRQRYRQTEKQIRGQTDIKRQKEKRETRQILYF